MLHLTFFFVFGPHLLREVGLNGINGISFSVWIALGFVLMYNCTFSHDSIIFTKFCKLPWARVPVVIGNVVENYECLKRLGQTIFNL